MQVHVKSRCRFGLVLLVLALAPSEAEAQLRPLEPVDWDAVGAGSRVTGALGVGAFADQFATRAGSRGDLFELGNLAFGWTTGRVTLQGAGTIVRRFRERHISQPPEDDVNAARADGVRQDAGDFRVTTVVRLTSAAAASLVTLRFGTRLPTTDNRVGLDRDQTDFFALVGGRAPVGSAALFAEAGVSINGTRIPDYEQADVLAYTVGGEYRWTNVRTYALIVGHDDMHDWAVRGSEDLAELRAGMRIGNARWIDVSFVRGIAEHSPRAGMLLTAGTRIRVAPASP